MATVDVYADFFLPPPRFIIHKDGRIVSDTLEEFAAAYWIEGVRARTDEEKDKAARSLIALADPFGCQVIGSVTEIPGYAKAPLEPDVSGAVRPPFLTPARQGTVFWVGYTYTQMGGVIRRYHVAFRDGVLANPTTSVILGEDIGDAQYFE